MNLQRLEIIFERDNNYGCIDRTNNNSDTGNGFLDLHRNTVREEVDKESVIYDTVRWCDFYNCC